MRITIELTEAEARSATVMPQGLPQGLPQGTTPGAATGGGTDGGAPAEGLLLAVGAAEAGGTPMARGGGGGASAASPEGIDAGRGPAWLTEMIRDLGQPRRG